jgi:hypothetical protein
MNIPATEIRVGIGDALELIKRVWSRPTDNLLFKSSRSTTYYWYLVDN